MSLSQKQRLQLNYVWNVGFNKFHLILTVPEDCSIPEEC